MPFLLPQQPPYNLSSPDSSIAPMHHPGDSNPHFHPHPLRHDDPVIYFPSTHQRPWHPPRHTTVDPTYGSRLQPPYEADTPPHPHQIPEPRSTPALPPLYQANGSPQHPNQELGPHFAPLPASQQHDHDSPGGNQRGHPTALRAPRRRRTKPIAWLLVASCFLFSMIVIIGGLIILIVYVVFRPGNPKFDVSTATLNAANLDMGYLLNADVTILANFTNPNTKVDIDFTYVILEIYYEKRFIATRYIKPFTIKRRESRFADVHMVASQVTLTMEHSMELQQQMAIGRVQFEIRGLFKSTSWLGRFQYTHWLYANCHIIVTSPPTGVLFPNVRMD